MSETRTVSPTLEERLRDALEDASRATVMETRVSTGTARQPDTDTEIPYSRQRFSFLDDSFVEAFLAAAKEHGLVIGEGELDAAWKEAEDVLPEGWNLLIGNHRASGMNGWWATASEPFQEATQSYQIVSTTEKHRPPDPTPTAALRALAEKLTNG